MTLAVSVDPETRVQSVNVPREVVALLCSSKALRPWDTHTYPTLTSLYVLDILLLSFLNSTEPYYC